MKHHVWWFRDIKLYVTIMKAQHTWAILNTEWEFSLWESCDAVVTSEHTSLSDAYTVCVCVCVYNNTFPLLWIDHFIFSIWYHLFTCLLRSSIIRAIWIFFLPILSVWYSFLFQKYCTLDSSLALSLSLSDPQRSLSSVLVPLISKTPAFVPEQTRHRETQILSDERVISLSGKEKRWNKIKTFWKTEQLLICFINVSQKIIIFFLDIKD